MFFRDFYQVLAESGNPITALMLAQRNQLAAPDPTDRLPTNWAGFVIVRS
jgi:hypothetical protein